MVLNEAPDSRERSLTLMPARRRTAANACAACSIPWGDSGAALPEDQNHPSLVRTPVTAIAAEATPPATHGHLAGRRGG